MGIEKFIFNYSNKFFDNENILSRSHKMRQPIESLVNQIDEKVKLENASKVRSLKGILTHVWDKIMVFMLVFSDTFVM